MTLTWRYLVTVTCRQGHKAVEGDWLSMHVIETILTVDCHLLGSTALQRQHTLRLHYVKFSLRVSRRNLVYLYHLFSRV